MKGIKLGFHSFCVMINTIGMAIGMLTSNWPLTIWCAFWSFFSINQICILTGEK